MKKIININLSGRLIPIEDSAYEVLRQYLDSLKRYFAREEGGDEIVTDIESRIAEVFQDRLKNGAHCITDADVEAVKLSMGTPEQFDEAAPKDQQQQQKSNNDTFEPRPRKRFYRDPDNKVLSGVCGGLGAYFNLDPVIFRVVFALLVLGSFGAAAVVYVILWIATPYAETAAEKLEMRGEKVDLNNIKNTVQEEINSLKGQFKNAGNDIRNFSQGRGKQIGSDFERFFLGLARGLGKVITAISKSFFIFFAIVLLFVLVVLGIVLTMYSAAIIPFQSLAFSSGSQTVMFWAATGLLIGIPVLALVIFLIRVATGSRLSVRYVTPTLTFLWILGLVFAIIVAGQLGRETRRSSTTVENVAITQPKAGKLYLKAGPRLSILDNNDDIDFGDWMEDFNATDTMLIPDVRLRISQSPDNDFHLKLVRFAKGRNPGDAQNNASAIIYSIAQKDSVIVLPLGFGITKNTRYRLQRLIVNVEVPKGKHLDVEENIYNSLSPDTYNYVVGDNFDFDGFGDFRFRHHRRHYRMESTSDGLQLQEDTSVKSHDDTSRVKIDVNNRNAKDSAESQYRYHG
ncbi:PspC domain-containing protein [Chitinophaga sp. Cy-1792]|uniref:PspC domain-containing protein n=1 Tax=Chitinophaga sp. Cy-1792 TaxID=2608339 RepID=UPI001422065C|nr:PspC domain-containing protein [Chitinophaga sp. Cy-1792]NIG52386.1 PspC domain-containing protein [Chitinophaga sp. Cy-1792]